MAIGNADRDRRAGLKSGWTEAASGVDEAAEHCSAGITGFLPKRHDVELEPRRLAAIVAFSGGAMIGTSLDGTVTTSDRAAEAIHARSDREGEWIERYETRRRCKNGRKVAISPIYDADDWYTT
jgi:hypothetical protein